MAKKVNTLAMPLLGYGYKMESKARVKSGSATIKAMEMLPLSVLVAKKVNTSAMPLTKCGFKTAIREKVNCGLKETHSPVGRNSD